MVSHLPCACGVILFVGQRCRSRGLSGCLMAACKQLRYPPSSGQHFRKLAPVRWLALVCLSKNNCKLFQALPSCQAQLLPAYSKNTLLFLLRMQQHMPLNRSQTRKCQVDVAPTLYAMIQTLSMIDLWDTCKPLYSAQGTLTKKVWESCEMQHGKHQCWFYVMACHWVSPLFRSKRIQLQCCASWSYQICMLLGIVDGHLPRSSLLHSPRDRVLLQQLLRHVQAETGHKIHRSCTSKH